MIFWTLLFLLTIPPGCRSLELCAYKNNSFPREDWCRDDTVINVIAASYEHCTGCLTNNTCPTLTEGCQVELQEATWVFVLVTCNGKTGCSLEAGSAWTICGGRIKSDYMKIVYECVYPLTSPPMSLSSSSPGLPTQSGQPPTSPGVSGGVRDTGRECSDPDFSCSFNPALIIAVAVSGAVNVVLVTTLVAVICRHRKIAGTAAAGDDIAAHYIEIDAAARTGRPASYTTLHRVTDNNRQLPENEYCMIPAQLD